jgi:hypothetical protein
LKIKEKALISSGLFAPCLEIPIEICPAFLRILCKTVLSRKKSITCQERQHTREVLFLNKIRAAWHCFAWFKSEGVFSNEHAREAAFPTETSRSIFLLTLSMAARAKLVEIWYKNNTHHTISIRLHTTHKSKYHLQFVTWLKRFVRVERSD